MTRDTTVHEYSGATALAVWLDQCSASLGRRACGLWSRCYVRGMGFRAFPGGSLASGPTVCEAVLPLSHAYAGGTLGRWNRRDEIVARLRALAGRPACPK